MSSGTEPPPRSSCLGLLQQLVGAGCTSSTLLIIGYMILTLPCALARRMARNWALKSSGWCIRQKPDGRGSPGTGSAPWVKSRRAELVAAQVQRADDHRRRRRAAPPCVVRGARCSSSPAASSPDRYRYSERNSPTPSAPLPATASISSSPSMLADRTIRMAVLGLRRLDRAARRAAGRWSAAPRASRPYSVQLAPASDG